MKGAKFRSLIYFLLVLLFTGLLVPACYYDSEESLYPSLNSSCDTSNVSYTSVIEPMINDHCIQCHSGTTPPELVTFTEVVANAESIFGAISYAQGFVPMPSGAPKLDTCTIFLMNIWIINGKPQ